MRTEEIPARDGWPLAATFFESPAPRGAVFIVPAMGVAQRYYEPLARWLAARGYTVATFDYRGIGSSRRGSVRHTPGDLFTWASDCAAVLDHFTRTTGALPLTWIGHSLGGQIIPFVENHSAAGRIITIASGSGYWRENAPSLRRYVWWLWYFAVPVSLPLFGYFPGRTLRKIGDVPHDVMKQWRRWCLHREYAAGAEEGARDAYRRVTTPMTSISFSDDAYMSARNVESLHSFYENAPRTMIRLTPQIAQVDAIGHFGFFRSALHPLWERHLLPELGDVPAGRIG